MEPTINTDYAQEKKHVKRFFCLKKNGSPGSQIDQNKCSAYGHFFIDRNYNIMYVPVQVQQTFFNLKEEP